MLHRLTSYIFISLHHYIPNTSHSLHVFITLHLITAEQSVWIEKNYLSSVVSYSAYVFFIVPDSTLMSILVQSPYNLLQITHFLWNSSCCIFAQVLI